MLWKKLCRSPVHKDPVEARQGLLGRPMLLVLVGGLVLALGAWGVAEIYGESVDSTSTEQVQRSNGNNPPARDQRLHPATNRQTQIDRDPTPQTGMGGQSQTNSPNRTEK